MVNPCQLGQKFGNFAKVFDKLQVIITQAYKNL
jgi:hypothetical protein